MNTNGVTSREIMWIGAVGGISLGVLKLIESRFYLDNVFGTTAIAAYLTYIGYVFFGVVIAHFFVERDLPDDKLRKNAFILGLLAPSVLMAMSARPIGEDAFVDDSLSGITKLGALLIQPAWAACPPGQVPSGSDACAKAELLTKQQLEPKFWQALMNAIGRGAVAKKYSFVVGATDDAETARKVATGINESILVAPGVFFMEARVVMPEGIDIFFVTVGEPSSKAEIASVTISTKGAAIDALKNLESPMAETYAELILRGRVVDTRSLFAGT